MGEFMKKFIVIISLAIVFSLGAFGLVSSPVSAYADLVIKEPTQGDIVEQAGDGFVMDENVSVRLSGKAMRFSTTVSKEFHQEISSGAIEVKYFATMKAEGVDKVISVPYGASPDFSAESSYRLNAYLNYDKTDESVFNYVLDKEFECTAYARVIKNSGTVFYKAKNGGNIKGSMRGIANGSYINYEEGAGYEREDILNLGFFSEGNRTSALVGTIKNGKLTFNMPSYGALANGTSIYAYIQKDRFTVTYDSVNRVFSANVGNDFIVGQSHYVTIFSADGKAYSGKVQVVEEFNGYSITLSPNYDMKLSYSKVTPSQDWEITEIDQSYYYLHVTCGIKGEQSQTFVVEDLSTLELPSVEVIFPKSSIAGVSEFSFGDKWRYYYSDGYIDFKIDDGSISEIVKYKNVQDFGKEITMEDVEQIFSNQEIVNGYRNITLSPYCKRAWS